MNWTCVHDIISAGFTSLYCALMTFESRRGGDGGAEDLPETQGTLLEAVSACVEILGRIAATWKTVDRHLRTFDALSKAVQKLIQEQPAVGPVRCFGCNRIAGAGFNRVCPGKRRC